MLKIELNEKSNIKSKYELSYNDIKTDCGLYEADRKENIIYMVSEWEKVPVLMIDLEDLASGLEPAETKELMKLKFKESDKKIVLEFSNNNW